MTVLTGNDPDNESSMTGGRDRVNRASHDGRGKCVCFSLVLKTKLNYSRIVPSAVVLPELVDEAGVSPTRTNKRRASSTSSSASKRQRLDSNDPLPTETNPASTRRDAVDIDERKRGKRLFGGLLGTLSQNSSSTAQRRRVDIERKQREKLKAQKDEDEEVKRSRQEEIDAAKRTRQKIWDAESVGIALL